MTLAKIISFCLCLVAMFLALRAHAELSEIEQNIISGESVAARPLLERALRLEKYIYGGW